MLNPFENKLQQLQRSIDAAMPAILQKAGAIGLEFFDQNFQLGGFQGATFQPWQKRNPDKTPGRAILIKSGHLRGGNRFVPIGRDGIKFMNSVPYARIHNEGGDINHPGGTQTLSFRRLKNGQMRFAQENGRHKITAQARVSIGAHVIRMPQRKFMGDSPILRQRIRNMIMMEMAGNFKLSK